MKSNVVRVTKRFTFELAHALYNYDGNCKFLHGHSYKMYVSLKGQVKADIGNPKDGMVCDFSILKKIVNEKVVDIYDHALVLNENDKNKDQYLNLNKRTIIFPVQPTCENLMIHFKNEIEQALPKELSLAKITLYETEGSYAEWDVNDQGGVE
jgi:6-pyruvoyltetrahydropterin/6-carboxytetrahydropterin synthase